MNARGRIGRIGVALALWMMALGAQGQGTVLERPVVPADQSTVRVLGRIRPMSPVRIGGVFTMGLGDAPNPLEDSALNGTRLSDENLRWIAGNCDVVAFNAVNILPATFPEIVRRQPLFTPLLHFRASVLYEQPYYPGNVGGWRPSMQRWTLRDLQGKEIPYPTSGGHWMDFGNIEWAGFWRDQVLNWLRQFQAQGVVVSELPVSNDAISEKTKYKTETERIDAAYAWLQAVQGKQQFFVVPSTLGFDLLAPRPTLPTAPGTERPNLIGRLWDYYQPMTDGGWGEGWIAPYWLQSTVSAAMREMHLQAADRAARAGQVFIATAAYRSDAELETILAHYLLVAHKQGRFVLQPMPQIPLLPPDAGYSLAILRQHVKAKSAYFNVPLGGALQDRQRIPVQVSATVEKVGTHLWKRGYQHGVVYVNPYDDLPVVVPLGGDMKRISGELVRSVTLSPGGGVVLLYPSDANSAQLK